MRQLHIEWKHLEEGGETCLRCSETGKTLSQVIEDLADELEPRGVEVTFTETKLSGREVSQSNTIFFNGVALEDVLSEVRVAESYCPSCCSLMGKETYCRMIEYEGKIYEAVPEAVIRRAALKVIGLG